jgi:6-phosphogluconolactonase/glucosamine-6-phosphate isomerase/deaminase
VEYIYNDDPVTAAAEHLARSITSQLSAGNSVLWFLSGGSGAHVVLAAARMLKEVDLSNLSVTLTDERYGPMGHKDENWRQLLDGGFELPGATLYRPLIDDDRISTTDKFGAWIMQQISTVDYTIGLFGIGSDGHTAGIKPHSDAASAGAWAESYIGDDFERITITPFTISQINEAVIQASGTEKADTLKQLIHDTIDVTDQPAQILKSVSKCSLYTNNKEISS